MKRALLVGIDDYAGNALDGCVADATALGELLKRNQDGSRNYDVRVMTSNIESVTRACVRSRLLELFENSRGDTLLFFFSGHGAQTPWGAELVTQDFSENALGVSVNDVLTLANQSPAQEIVIVIDACYSGDLGNIAGLQPIGLSEAFSAGRALIREGIAILAASQATETAAEVGGQGAFTRLLLEGLEGGAADHLGEVSAMSLFDFASRAFGAWQQRPVFKSHLTRSSALRVCSPWIDPALLRRLPEFFVTVEARHKMTPEYEGTRPVPQGTALTDKQAAFDYFKALRNAGLLGTDGDEDLYFVALGSRKVYLTALGRYFWNLAKQDKL